MDYNFNKDLAEMSESTEYVDDPLAEGDEDDEGELV